MTSHDVKTAALAKCLEYATLLDRMGMSMEELAGQVLRITSPNVDEDEQRWRTSAAVGL